MYDQGRWASGAPHRIQRVDVRLAEDGSRRGEVHHIVEVGGGLVLDPAGHEVEESTYRKTGPKPWRISVLYDEQRPPWLVAEVTYEGP